MVTNLYYLPGLGNSDHVCLRFNLIMLYTVATILRVAITTTLIKQIFHRGM